MAEAHLSSLDMSSLDREESLSGDEEEKERRQSVPESGEPSEMEKKDILHSSRHPRSPRVWRSLIGNYVFPPAGLSEGCEALRGHSSAADGEVSSTAKEEETEETKGE